MTTTRRELIKMTAVATAGSALGIQVPAHASNVVTDKAHTSLNWNKAPCRFCGTGCSVNVATKNGKVVATHGDIHSPVNKGLN